MSQSTSTFISDEPYVFVSYSHKEEQEVRTDIAWLKGSGFNIWYDEGIEAGAEWRAEIETAIKN